MKLPKWGVGFWRCGKYNISISSQINRNFWMFSEAAGANEKQMLNFRASECISPYWIDLLAEHWQGSGLEPRLSVSQLSGQAAVTLHPNGSGTGLQHLPKGERHSGKCQGCQGLSWRIKSTVTINGWIWELVNIHKLAFLPNIRMRNFTWRSLLTYKILPSGWISCPLIGCSPTPLAESQIKLWIISKLTVLAPW